MEKLEINDLMELIKNKDYEKVKEYMLDNPDSKFSLEIKKILSVILNEDLKDGTI